MFKKMENIYNDNHQQKKYVDQKNLFSPNNDIIYSFVKKMNLLYHQNYLNELERSSFFQK